MISSSSSNRKHKGICVSPSMNWKYWKPAQRVGWTVWSQISAQEENGIGFGCPKSLPLQDD